MPGYGIRLNGAVSLKHLSHAAATAAAASSSVETVLEAAT